MEITDLDKHVDFQCYQCNKKCSMVITHRAIMDVGIAPYLQDIISSILSALEDKNLFGNYKASMAIITGDLLHQWLYKTHPVYSNYIWHQLVKELAHQTYIKQTKTNIVLAKKYIQQHHASGYIPFEIRKYQQVLSKSYFLQVEHVNGLEVEVYIKHGSSYEKVPHRKMPNNRNRWIIKLNEQQAGEISQHGITKSIHFHLKEKPAEPSSNTYKMIYYLIGRDSRGVSTAYQLILEFLY